MTKAISMERRKFIQVLSSAAGGTVIPLNFAGCGLNGAVVINSRHKPTLDSPLTPLVDFYINANYGIVERAKAPSEYRLQLKGLVDRDQAVSFDQLMALPQVEDTFTLECIGNRSGGGLISSQVFTGVRLRDVMGLASVSDRARALYLVGLDGYPIAVLEEDNALLVHSLGGEPLDINHGAPFRALFPSRFGMFSVKWLDSITAVRQWGTWGSFRGLSSSFEGTKRTRSRLDSPTEGATATVGQPIMISGLAASSGTGIRKVEVRTEQGWMDAPILFNTLEDERSGLLWSLYGYEWTPTQPGEITLAVRATDTEGEEQSFDRRFPYDGSSIHTVRVLVRS